MLPNCKQSVPVLLVLLFILNPVQGLQCYKCDSLSTPNCALDPSDGLPTSECPDEDSMCAMAVLDDMATYRGCSSDIQIPDNCRNCKNETCTDDLCNGSIYPENRVKCYKCEGGECVTVTGSPQVCQNYDSSDYCYIDVIDETDAIRGCVSDDDYNAGVYTRFCRNGDGCNNSTAVSQFSCLSCDSDIDDDCKHGDLSSGNCKVNVSDVCTIDVLYGRSETCFTYHNGERVVRGCSRLDPELYMQSQYISTCRNSECNSACVKSPTCYICDSNTDSECVSNQLSLTPKDCPVGTTSCFTCKHDDDSLTRGCFNETSLLGTCQICSNPQGCNSEEILVCYECNSDDNENCATWHHEETLDIQICPGLCLNKITKEGKTIRGCDSLELKCDPEDLTCSTCKDSVCNGGIFPTDRMQCFQCNETDTLCEYEQIGRPYACPAFDSMAGCYQFLNEDSKMIRGCTGDLRYHECLENEKSCIVCNQSECNSLAKKKTNTLSCMFCSDGEQCPWTQFSAKSCTSRIDFYQEPSCFTHVYSNKTVVRGCVGEESACDSVDENCEICFFAGCNKANKIYQSCVQCSAFIGNGTCADSAQDIDATLCPNDTQFYDQRGCYVLQDGNQVTRGCISSLEETDLVMCNVNSKFCKTCLTQNCNYMKISNSANRLFECPYLLIVLITIALKYSAKTFHL